MYFSQLYCIQLAHGYYYGEDDNDNWDILFQCKNWKYLSETYVQQSLNLILQAKMYRKIHCILK